MRHLDELRICHEPGIGFPTVGPTAAEIEELEGVIGAPLPSSYLELLSFINGGGPGCNIVIPVADSLKPYQGLNVIYFLNSDKSNLCGVWRNYFGLKNAIPQGSFPIGNDLGGNPYVLKATDAGGSIWMGFHDDNLELQMVATSFENFINSLLPYKDLPKIDPKFELGANGRPRLKREYADDRSE